MDGYGFTVLLFLMAESMIAFLTNDLIFQSRVASIASSSHNRIVADRTVERLLMKLDKEVDVGVIIVDLGLDHGDLSDLLSTFKAKYPQAKSIAYGPHVHEARLKRAVDAGFDQVMTRGQFDRQMNAIIAGDNPSDSE